MEQAPNAEPSSCLLVYAALQLLVYAVLMLLVNAALSC
jgi:hypothetical protein